MNIMVKKLTNTATIPVFESKGAVGADLSADITQAIYIRPHETVKIPTGIAMSFPELTYGEVYARSGIATKQGLRPANCVGIIDNDYRGEIIVAIHNDSDEIRIIEPQQRIAQLIIRSYIISEFVETDELDQTERGEGGFGSTGK